MNPRRLNAPLAVVAALSVAGTAALAVALETEEGPAETVDSAVEARDQTTTTAAPQNVTAPQERTGAHSTAGPGMGPGPAGTRAESNGPAATTTVPPVEPPPDQTAATTAPSTTTTTAPSTTTTTEEEPTTTTVDTNL